MVDFNFARPFNIGTLNFSVEGHVEYIGERDNELGDKDTDESTVQALLVLSF